jgi:hypothetical protein
LVVLGLKQILYNKLRTKNFTSRNSLFIKLLTYLFKQVKIASCGLNVEHITHIEVRYGNLLFGNHYDCTGEIERIGLKDDGGWGRNFEIGNVKRY